MNKKMMFLAPGLVLGAVVMAEQPQVKAQQAPDNMSVRVNIGRQQLSLESSVTMRRANEAKSNGEYDTAIKLYREVIKKLEPYKSGDIFRERIEVCGKLIADCYLAKAEVAMRKADDAATSNDFEAAIKLCREAQRFYPEKRDELAKKIVFYETRRNAALNRENSSLAKLAPNHSVQEYNIQLLMEQGRALAGRNELTQARRKFEEVLLLDPFNADASQNLEGINSRIRKDARLRANATSRRMIAKVEWDSVIPIVADAPVGEPDNQIDAPVAKVAENAVMKKLKSIIIPRMAVEENEVTFSQLMQDIQRDCRRYDKDKRGVNFVVRNLPVPDGQEEPTLKSFSKERISVYNLLQDLQSSGVLTFKVGDSAVLIAQAGLALEDMEVRRFPFSLKKDDEAKVFMQYFVASGIPFGAGASVQLLRARNLVIVRNTPDNLNKVGVVLEGLRESEPMVQVMFKFIEVGQSDLDELGFNWSYQRLNNDGSITSFSTNELLRHYSTEDERYNGVTATGNGREGDRTLAFEWFDRANSFSAGVYALDWADASDVLYSPRVTTLSGTTAVINMSEKHYYPEDWETVDIESAGGLRIEVSPQPSLDDEQDTGVSFSVTPKADKKTGLIEMNINIPIKQFVEWMTVDARTGEDGEDGEYIKKPVLSERNIKTIVTVKDGETVLVGGMAMDNIQSINDKVPILGDIPFIGRFFQNKYVKSQKNHLLVFMTCRMIKPDGSAIKPKAEETGLPEFSRNI